MYLIGYLLVEREEVLHRVAQQHGSTYLSDETIAGSSHAVSGAGFHLTTE
jgi:hypothetical protein